MKKNNIITYIVSLFFSISMVLTLYIGNINRMNDSFITDFHFKRLFFIVPVIILSLLIFLVLKLFLKLVVDYYFYLLIILEQE